MRFRRIHGGGIQYGYQCCTCGRMVGHALKHSDVKELPPEWDYDLNDAWRAAQSRLVEQWSAGRSQEQREKYAAYLRSPEWRARRQLVMERERWVCQGCMVNRATQVHHTTYAHIFNELLFELVALCDDCHDAAHEEGRGLSV